ncbi:hypothetical protein DVH05_006127 [Phytophthora capsici]|nr:hypothetical protein DVH05_006127 [Phytophthora capsici]
MVARTHKRYTGNDKTANGNDRLEAVATDGQSDKAGELTCTAAGESSNEQADAIFPFFNADSWGSPGGTLADPMAKLLEAFAPIAAPHATESVLPGF